MLVKLNLPDKYYQQQKKVTYKIDFKRVINRKLIMGIADGEVYVDGKLIYEAKDLKVGLFKDTTAF